MNILLLGSSGFIGKNTLDFFAKHGSIQIAKIDVDDALLLKHISKADIVINAVGVSRSENEHDFFAYNMFHAQRLYSLCNEFNDKTIVYFSSIHFNSNNLYGISKRYNEFLLKETKYSLRNRVLCYRLPGIFGPGLKPNYVSVVGTFCYNVARGLPCEIIDGDKIIRLLYVNDLMLNILNSIKKDFVPGYQLIDEFHELIQISVNDLFTRIRKIGNGENVNFNSSTFDQNLYKTYKSYVD